MTTSKDNLSSAEEQVQELRRIITIEGLKAGEEYLSSLGDGNKPELIVPLMMMREYNGDTSHVDEMWAIVHFVEGYPRDSRIPQIFGNFDSLSEHSPELLSILLLRISNSEDGRNFVLNYIRQHPLRALSGTSIELLEKCQNVVDDKPLRKQFFAALVASTIKQE